MSARSRAAPWFGTKAERSVEPEPPVGTDREMLIEARRLRNISPAEAERRAAAAFAEAIERKCEDLEKWRSGWADVFPEVFGSA